MAIVATLIFVYGNDLNRFVKRQVRNKHFLVRLSIFVLVCAFGFGLATVLGMTLISRLLQRLDRELLAPVVLAIFVGIGFLAERKHHM